MCHRGRYWRESTSWHYLQRDITIRVIRNNICCGMAKLVEWKDEGGASDPEEFWFEADAYSHEDAEFASTICEHWDELTWPFDYGTVTNFDRIVIDTVADPERRSWELIAADTLKELMPRCAALLFEVFPLEYAGLGSEFSERIERRRRLLMDRFNDKFGAKAFEDLRGNDGWMWMPVRFCPIPTKTVES